MNLPLNNHNYQLKIKYPQGYFLDKKTPLIQTVNCHTSEAKSKSELQEMYYPNCEVLEMIEKGWGETQTQTQLDY